MEDAWEKNYWELQQELAAILEVSASHTSVNAILDLIRELVQNNKDLRAEISRLKAELNG